MKNLSIIIPYHQEGEMFLMDGINQIMDTIDVSDYEIIVVDDGSAIPLRDLPGIKVIRHNVNKGVGVAFDTGTAAAQSDNIFLAASDIRYIKNNWASQMVKEIQEQPKAFICTSCVNLNAEKPENLDITKRRLISVVNGATILLFHDQKSNPHMTATFRGIIEAKWLPSLKSRDVDSFEIPCILGAAYGVSKAWYEYVDGWWGHKLWGTLEPYISMKSYLFGGSCRTLPRVETGHIFKKVGWHGTSQDSLMYNKMMIATLLFDDYPRLINFLGHNSILDRAKIMYEKEFSTIMQKRLEYKAKTTYSMEDFISRWKLDYRK